MLRYDSQTSLYIGSKHRLHFRYIVYMRSLSIKPLRCIRGKAKHMSYDLEANRMSWSIY